MTASPAPSACAPRATLVTGCSSGIGRAIAIRLAEKDWPVYASARRVEDIRDLARHGCTLLSLDVTNEDSRREAVGQIERDHGAVGALVNNAGYGQQGPFEETPLSAFRGQFETNVFAAVALCQGVLPGMRRQGRGRIVNLSSMGGRLSFPGGAAYHGSKYALEAISDVLRFEVAGFGIQVVVVEPGPVTSDFGRSSLQSFEHLEPSPDGAYDDFRAGVEAALRSTFDSDSGGGRAGKASDTSRGASTPEEVADAVWQSLIEDPPKPRIVVGDAAARFISMKESSSEKEWDQLLAGLYPRPGGTNGSD